MKNSYFYKIFKAFLIFVFLYTIVASIIYFYSDNKMSLMDINNRSKVFVDQARDRIDTRLQIAFNLSNQLCNNVDVIQFVSNQQINYYNVLQVNKQLQNHLDAFSKFGYEISIGKPNNDLLITGRMSADTNRYLRETGFESLQKGLIDEYFKDSSNTYRTAYTERNSKDSIFMLISKKTIQSTSSSGFFYMVFDGRDTFPILGNDSGEAFLLMDNNKAIVEMKHDIDSKDLEHMISQVSQGNYTKDKTTETFNRLEYKNYYIYIVTSNIDELNWNYIYVTQKGIGYKNKLLIGLRLLIVFIILIFIGLILTYVITKKVYFPVKKIINLFNDGNDESKRDEFLYIEENFSRISEMNNKLKQMINEDLGEINKGLYYYPLDIEKALVHFTIMGKKSEVDAILKEIFNENFKVRCLTREAISQFIYAIVTTANRVMENLSHEDLEYLETNKLTYADIKVLENSEKIIQKVTELYEYLISIVAKENDRVDDATMNKMLEFVYANCHKDLALSDVADNFGFSVGYTGILFKKKTGETFKDYLNMCKVQRAKRIMEEQDIKIKDLSEMLGCNNTNTFIRIFKKYVGMAPGKYMETIRNDK